MLLTPPQDEWHHVYAHIDADAFFASCEQLRHPKLKNKPVCVGGQIIVAKSYEAKKYGIKTGTPIWKAKKMCPHAVFLPGDHRFYGKVSQQMFANLRTFSPDIEVFSIDEAFLNLQGVLGMHRCKNYIELADKLRNQIKKKVGITVSIGISTTRLLAKLASESNKPDGSTVVSQSQIQQFLENKHVGEICGIGRANQKSLATFGVETIDEFLKWDMERVRKSFGKLGVEIWAEMQGFSIIGLQTKSKPPKSMIKTASYLKCHNNKNTLKASLLSHLDRAFDKLKKTKMLSKKIGLYLRYENFSNECHIIELDDYTNNYQEFLEKIMLLFEYHYTKDKSYRSCGVYFGELYEASKRQYSIYSPQMRKSSQLSQAKKRIEIKYGKGKLLRATEMFNKKHKEDIFDRFNLPVLN